MAVLTEKLIRRNVAINVWRLRGELTQERLAAKCSCDEWKPNTIAINRIEKGTFGLKLFTAYRLSIALGVKLADLIANPPGEFLSGPPKNPLKNRAKPGKKRRKKRKKSRIDRLAENDKLSRSDEFDDL